LALRCSVIVCAHNEAEYLAGCLHSLLAQSRPPDEILVVDNASTDGTRMLAEGVPGVRVVVETRKGLTIARETARRHATGDLLVYVDADCRSPMEWLQRVERRFLRDPRLVAQSGLPDDDRDWRGRLRSRLRPHMAPATTLGEVFAARRHHLLRRNFAASRALERIGGFDTSRNFTARTNVDRRLCAVGRYRRPAVLGVHRAAHAAMGQEPCCGSTHATSRRRSCTTAQRTPPTWT
jgi:glycosyltransferase involved in cell wall biosynthesis